MSAISEAREIDETATAINRRSQEFDDFYSATPEEQEYQQAVACEEHEAWLDFESKTRR